MDPSDLGKGVIAAITDVSERKHAEEALRQSEEKYRATFSNAAVGIDLVDGKGRFIEANATLADFLGTAAKNSLPWPYLTLPIRRILSYQRK